jgi:hypothetical protein
LRDYEALGFKDRLLPATHHRVREHQMIAVRALGERRSTKALERFAEIFRSSEGPLARVNGNPEGELHR